MRIVVHAGLSWSQWSPHPVDFEDNEPTAAAAAAAAMTTTSGGTSVQARGGLGGSQLAATRVAHALAASGHIVTLFGDFTDAAMARAPVQDGLALGALTDYERCVGAEHIDLLVVSRYARFLRLGTNVRRVYLWCHDVTPMDDVARHVASAATTTTTTTTTTGAAPVTVLALSEWHARHMRPSIPASMPIVRTRNGLEPSLFEAEPWPRIVPHRFIYSSAIYRGLDTVLACWPHIRARLPNATLHVYADFHSPLVEQRMSALSRRLTECVERLRRDHGDDSVRCFGFVAQRALREAWYEADAWFYPTQFSETYCITALEAQASGTLCCYAPVAALCETVGAERGIELPAGTTDAEQLAAAVCDALTSDTRAKRVAARAWALEQTWDGVARQWIDECGGAAGGARGVLSP